MIAPPVWLLVALPSRHEPSRGGATQFSDTRRVRDCPVYTVLSPFKITRAFLDVTLSANAVVCVVCWTVVLVRSRSPNFVNIGTERRIAMTSAVLFVTFTSVVDNAIEGSGSILGGFYIVGLR